MTAGYRFGQNLLTPKSSVMKPSIIMSAILFVFSLMARADIKKMLQDVAKSDTLLQTQLIGFQKQKSEIGENSLNLLNEILQIQQEIIGKEKENTKSEDNAAIEIELKKLRSDLESKQKTYGRVSNLESQILDIEGKLNLNARNLKELSRTEAYQALGNSDKAYAEQRKQASEEAAANRLRNEISAFIGTVQGWSALASNYSFLAQGAESLLIFEEKTGKVIQKVLKSGGMDIMAILGGVLAYENFQKEESLEAVLYALGGTLVKVIQGLIKPNKTIEAVTRNVVFSDEMRAFNSLGKTLKGKVDVLYKRISTVEDQSEYKPTKNDLIVYKDIITLLQDIQFQNKKLKSDAEFLLQSAEQNEHTLSDEGRKYLQALIDLYNGNIKDFEAIQAINLYRYNLLWDAFENDELASLSD